MRITNHAVAVATVFVASLLAPSSTTTSAQSLGTDLLVVDSTASLYRVTPGGRIRMIRNYSSASRPTAQAIIVDANDRFAVLSLTSNPQTTFTGSLVRIDLDRGTPTTVYAGQPMLSLTLDQDGHYLAGGVSLPVVGGSHVVQVDRATGAIATLLSGSVSPTALTRDVHTGDWISAYFLIGQPTASRFDSTFSTRLTTTPSPNWLHESEALPDTGDVYFSSSSEIYRYTTQGPPLLTRHFGPYPNPGLWSAIAVDRGPSQLKGEVVYFPVFQNGAYRILATDANGVVHNSIGPFPASVTGLAFDRSRNLTSVLTQPPHDRALAVSFAGEGGRGYVVALSTSGSLPGVLLPDGRRIAINPDGLTLASVNGQLSPLLRNQVGVLDSTGRAAATLSLNPLGPAVRGARIWAAAIVLDPNAPSGVSQVGAPIVITL